MQIDLYLRICCCGHIVTVSSSEWAGMGLQMCDPDLDGADTVIPEDGRVVPLVVGVDCGIRAAAIEWFVNAFSADAEFPDPVAYTRVAAAFVDSQPGTFRQALIDAKLGNLGLSQVWLRLALIRANRQPDSRKAAAYMVAAFLRIGEPFLPSFLDVISNMTSPLLTGVLLSPILAHALLDLPLNCGLDVNAKLDDSIENGPAIGYIHLSNRLSPSLFERLLCRTDRAVVSCGAVFVERQAYRLRQTADHVFVGSLLRFTVCHDNNLELGQILQLFIANAQPDGGGADLTGGISRPGSDPPDRPVWFSGPQPIDPTPTDLWPDGKFLGSLALVDKLYTWYMPQPTKMARNIADDLVPIRNNIIDALRRIRQYRKDLQPSVGSFLAAGGIYVHWLYGLIAQLVLVPLHDESQLKHPLITTTLPTQL
jgi:hypothetical protein